MHKVVVDRSHAVVSVTAEGFITDDELAQAAADLHAAIRSLGPRAGKHVTLYDLSGLKVSSPATIEAFGRYFTDPRVAPLWAVRVAFVTGSALVTQQIERMSKVRDTLRVFGDRREALAWLRAGQEEAGAH